MGRVGEFRGTTVVAVRKDGVTAVAADGQVSIGDTVIKKGARKVRKMYDDRVIVGFAGSTADAMTLFDRLEKKLQECRGNLMRAAVELAKDWRTDKVLRPLEALMIAADGGSLFLISGSGDVIEPDDGLLAIGSGGAYALAAARALLKHSRQGARDIALESLKIASAICVYTNEEIIVEEITE
ncbi:MAG: ATP-dependent protease subunit HslV [Deltaproteobacteria bacterium]|nr:ATP-dependent protease subunit HslV [Deltaproteobacteria bacterium]NIS76390.1 ATP-dependent protease subunit HslV [Deltaproteobacteria bacterium]